MQPLTHRLSAEHLAELGAGYGSAACLKELRAGQSSRRLLMIRAIADSAPVTEPALALLKAVARHAPQVTEQALSHPMVGVWASRWLRQGTGDPGYLAGLAAAAAARAQLSFSLPVQTVDGTVALPTLGTAHRLGDGTATITGSGKGLVIEGPARALRLKPPYTSRVRGWLAPWQASTVDHVVAIEDLDRYRDCFSFPPEPRLSAEQAEVFAGSVVKAWKIISVRHPRHAEAMNGSLRALVPLTALATGNGVSAVSRSAFGAIGVGLSDNPETIAELLIHEFQHMKLGALLDMVELHSLGGPAIHCAPWRADARPIGPLLQGTFAHLGVTDYWRMRHIHTTGVQSRHAEVEFAYWLAQTSRAAATVAASGELTEAGARFVSHLRDTLAKWSSEIGSTDVLVAAEDLADSAVILWRLHNRVAAEGEAARLAVTFREGASCPVLTAALPSPGTPPGPAKPIPLASMLRHRLRDPLSQPEGTPSDVAFVLGNHSQAIDGYHAILRQDPDANDAWAGLALALRRHGKRLEASAIIARPELVRAVFRHTSAAAAEVAAWLSPRVMADRCRR